MIFSIKLDEFPLDDKYMVKDVISAALTLSSNELRRELTKNSPKGETKFLYASWYIENLNDTQRNIYSDVKYSEWVNSGTGLYGPYKHRIVPVKAKLLVFKLNGQKIFAKSVKGQKGQRFVEKSIDNTEDKIENIFAMVMQQQM